MITKYLETYDPLQPAMLVKDKVVDGIQVYVRGEDLQNELPDRSLEITDLF